MLDGNPVLQAAYLAVACLSACNFEIPRWIDCAPFPLAVADTGQLVLTASVDCFGLVAQW